jgi:hypothetical protein
MAGKQRALMVIYGAIGLSTWLLTEVIALALAGAGHGWGAPMVFSLPLVLLYPTLFVRVFWSESKNRLVDACVLATAAALDLLLLLSPRVEDLGYFSTMWNGDAGWVVAWLALWAGWQMLAVAALLRTSPARIAAESS